MFKSLIVTTLALLTSFVFTPQVSASLLFDTYPSGSPTPTTIGGFSMTDFALIGGATATDSVASPISGTLNFLKENGDPLTLDHSTADANSWWENGESDDYDIYTTSDHWITMYLPADTFAFSFNVGANKRASGWFKAEAYDGSVINKTNITLPLGNDDAPGFAVYSDSDSCSAIKSITVEPPFIWGLGNFSISQGSCGTVPEPSVIALMATGFIGLFGSIVARRKRMSA